MKNNSYETKDLLKLYSLCINQLKYYNTLIWQFPTALATLNFLTIHFFHDKPELLFVLAIVNFSLLYALLRHILNSKKIIDSTREVEENLKENFSKMIPEFKPTKVKATTIVFIIFFLLNCCLLITAVHMLQNG